MTLDPTAPAAAALRTGQHVPPDEAASGSSSGTAQVRLRARRRRLLIYAAQAATFVVIFGGWQLFTSLKIVDPFFFGQPSGIVQTLWKWVQHGTAYGSVWSQIWVTMEEALLGFVFGVAGGVVFGILLGQVRFLADVLGPYIKAVNALPRIVLGSIFLIFLGLGMTSKVVLAAVLVFFVVFLTRSRASARWTRTSSPTPASSARRGCRSSATSSSPRR